MQAPQIEKITVNMGVGDGKQDTKMLEAASEQLAPDRRPEAERPPRPQVDRRFKLREGMPVGVAVTLRGERAYEFLDRLMSVAIPRIRDFRGLPAKLRRPRQLHDRRPRADHLPRDRLRRRGPVRGLDITITTSAKTDEEGFALLEMFGMPFVHEGRPGEQTTSQEQ